MSILKNISEAFFGKNNKAPSARESAKQRLSVVLINDRAGRDTPDFMPQLRQDIIEVLRKYIPIANDGDVEIHIENKHNVSFMELSVSLDKVNRE